jgi:hypothetical protein
MRLFHFSEDPNITRFDPHVPAHRREEGLEPLVYAIDEARVAMYYFPRDCPRACFWPGPETTAADRGRFYAGVTASRVIAIESAWLERVRACVLYRYEMPAESFVLVDDDAGHWHSRETVVPLSVEPVGDLLQAIVDAGAELRVVPTLRELWPAIVASTMRYSGTRLRNTEWWEAGG